MEVRARGADVAWASSANLARSIRMSSTASMQRGATEQLNRRDLILLSAGVAGPGRMVGASQAHPEGRKNFEMAQSHRLILREERSFAESVNGTFDAAAIPTAGD